MSQYTGISQLPKYTIGDSTYSKKGTYGSGDSFVYGVSGAEGVSESTKTYHVTHEWLGWRYYIQWTLSGELES